MNTNTLLNLIFTLAVLQNIQHSLEEKNTLPDFGFKVKKETLLQHFGQALTLFGVFSKLLLIATIGIAMIFVGRLFIRYKMRFPINGGSDSVFLLTISMTMLSAIFISIGSSVVLQKAPLYYLSVQMILSYFLAGIVKIKNQSWRTGEALNTILAQSHYSENPTAQDLLRIIKPKKSFFFFCSWVILVFELSFPVGLFHYQMTFLVIGLFFHFFNFLFFGLNRFFWTWVSTYPVLLWCTHQVTN